MRRPITPIYVCYVKRLSNRAHAYKGAVDANLENEQDPDFRYTMGCFVTLFLMRRWIILAFQLPRKYRCRDQIPHIEMGT